jgi:hypothetical protein
MICSRSVKNEKIRECISKLKVSKPNKSLFNKINKETLCDSLIFIAETGAVIQNDEIEEINESVLDMSNNPMSTQVEATKDEEEKVENILIAEDNLLRMRELYQGIENPWICFDSICQFTKDSFCGFDLRCGFQKICFADSICDAVFKRFDSQILFTKKKI